MSFAAGARLGPYVVEVALGRGGMGEVFRARDSRLDRVVAIKVLPAAVVSDPDRRVRFEREAKAIARLQHPHICGVFDVGTGDVPYLVLEYLTGHTLAERLAEAVVNLDEAAAWIEQLGRALEYAHGQGVIHRDLKPANVMITARGATLLDFGLATLDASGPADATAIGTPVTAEGLVLGTPGYMSPEQASGAVVDARSDIFAFGALCYELLTGAPAYRRATPAESLAALFGEGLPAASRVRPDLPGAVDEVLGRCLARVPGARYAGMSDAVDALLRALRRRPRPGATTPVPSPLPVQTNRLIGRDREIAEIGLLFASPGVRLVSLTGAGGTGKTRLAIEVGRALTPRYPGGVAFLALAAINDVAVLESAIAHALGAKPLAGEALASVVARAFQEDHRDATLLVLDNFEQLVDRAAMLSELLAAVPPLALLVTSRSVLRLSSEHEYPVPPLAIPDLTSRPSASALELVPSVALFAERARAANPAFAVGPDNAAAVAAIVARLDGLPLALELAAARIRHFTPQTLLPKLERSLQLLTSGARDMPLRQQTLRNTIDWSHGLLTEPEQRLLRRLAAFVGGGTLEAIEAVCDAELDLGVDVVDGVSSLVDKNLAQQRALPDGDTLITMFETIREYATERLTTADEREMVARAHAAYYVLLAEDGDAAMSGVEREKWLRRFSVEHDNFRTAFDWAAGSGHVEWAQRLGLALFRFWQWRGHLAEGLSRLKLLAALRADAVSPEASRLLMYAGVLASGLGDGPESDRAFLESLAISRQLRDRASEAIIVNNMGVSHRLRGDYDSARRYFEEALAQWRLAGDTSSVGRTLSNLATIAIAQRAFERCSELHAEALAIFEDEGDTASVALTLQAMGDASRAAARPDEAEQYYRRALGAWESVGDGLGVAGVQLDIGSLAADRGLPAQGRAALRRAIDGFIALGYTRGLARAVEEVAIALAREGQHESALRLAGGAAGLRRGIGMAASGAEHERLTRLIGPLRQAHGERAWLAGRDLDEAALLDEVRAAADGG